MNKGDDVLRGGWFLAPFPHRLTEGMEFNGLAGRADWPVAGAPRRHEVSTASKLNGEVPLSGFPLALCWSDPEHPLPVRRVRHLGRTPTVGLEAPPWLATGP